MVAPYRYIPSRLDSFKPDLVVYNAGTDILVGDRLGNLDITPEVHTRRCGYPEDYHVLLCFTEIY